MRILFVDVESTGLDVCRDRIVEIGMILPNGEDKTIRLNPTIHIPEVASNIHKIYDEDVKECKTFKDIAQKLHNLFNSVDLIVGYNYINYDDKILSSEFLRCGLNPINKPILDIYKLWNHVEKDKKLTTCYRRFVGNDLKNSHSASADITATRDCLYAIMQEYNIDLNEAIIRSQVYKK